MRALLPIHPLDPTTSRPSPCTTRGIVCSAAPHPTVDPRLRAAAHAYATERRAVGAQISITDPDKLDWALLAKVDWALLASLDSDRYRLDGRAVGAEGVASMLGTSGRARRRFPVHAPVPHEGADAHALHH